MIINAAIQIIPKSDNDNIYTIIDKAIEQIQASGLKHVVCPFETVVEGEYDKVFNLIKKLQETCFANGAIETLTNIKLQIRKDADVFITEKIGKYNSFPLK